MTIKVKANAAELLRMITEEMRAHPQFFNRIGDLTIVPTQQGSSNWKADYTIAATPSGPWPVCPEMDKLIQLFQNDFELAEIAS